jgi:CheY-like chemotaxis protein
VEYITILAVDDEFDIITIIKLSLKRNGYDVFAFTDPFMALEHFKINSKDYDLVISDIRMPGMNGYEFTKKVNGLKPEAKIVLMSAFEINDIELSKVIPDIKIDALLRKPFSLRALQNIIGLMASDEYSTHRVYATAVQALQSPTCTHQCTKCAALYDCGNSRDKCQMTFQCERCLLCADYETPRMWWW